MSKLKLDLEEENLDSVGERREIARSDQFNMSSKNVLVSSIN